MPRLLEAGASVSVLVRDWDPQSELIRERAVRSCRVVVAAAGIHAGRRAGPRRARRRHGLPSRRADHRRNRNRSPYGTFESNIRGSYTLFEACRRHAGAVRRIVVASSDKAYGESGVLPYTEEMPPRGRYPYDVSKCCADLLANCYAQSYELPIVVARCGNIYGGGDLNWSRLSRARSARPWRGQAPGDPLRRPLPPRLRLRRGRGRGLPARDGRADRVAGDPGPGLQFRPRRVRRPSSRWPVPSCG